MLDWRGTLEIEIERSWCKQNTQKLLAIKVILSIRANLLNQSLLEW